MTVRLQGHSQPTNDDVAGLGTGPIPAGPYYRPDYFELEREAIFRRMWLHIGHACELPEPGAFIVRPFETVGASVLITRGKDDRIRAFHNVCTHRGTLLVDEPRGKRALFTCPYHAWTFGNDGQLRSAPDFERFHIDKNDCALKEIAAEVCAGLIFVNFAKSPEWTLSEFLGPTFAELEAMPVARATGFSEWVYDIPVNWKLIMDNFQENYHLRFVHTRSGAAGVGKENPFGYPTGYQFQGRHRKQMLWSNPDVALSGVRGFGLKKGGELAYAAGLFDNPHTREYFGIYPNFSIVGTPSGHFSQTIVPLAPDRSRGSFRMYWVGDDANATERFAREMTMVTTMDVHAEDTTILEAGQVGLNSGALEHIHFQSQEAMCRHFFNQLDRDVRAHVAERGGREVRS